ncbi:MAG: hypothetical protein AAB857_01250, partial [Patescibacteria group bacterium]
MKVENSDSTIDVFTESWLTVSWNLANVSSCVKSGFIDFNGQAYSGSLDWFTGTKTYSLTCTKTYEPPSTVSDSVIVRGVNYSLSNGGNKTVSAGSFVTNSISASLISGNAKTVSFSASGSIFAQGATYSFSYPSCNPTCVTAIGINTPSNLPAGNYTIYVHGSVGRSTNFTLTVGQSFAYTLSNSGTLTVSRGSSGTNTVTVTKTGGTAASVALSVMNVSGPLLTALPAGVTASFNPVSCTPNQGADSICTSTLTFYVSSGTTVGDYTIRVLGTPSSGT